MDVIALDLGVKDVIKFDQICQFFPFEGIQLSSATQCYQLLKP